MPDPAVPYVRYLQAIVHHAFNAPARSNVVAAELMAGRPALSEANLFELRTFELLNHLRLFEYRAAAAKAAAILDAPPAAASDTERAEVRNLLRIFRALEDVPAQAVAVRRASVVEVAGGRVPVTLGSESRSFVFDTGANLSVIMRSEAESLGLRIRQAGIDVGTITDVKATADLAVADRLLIGGVELRNVVFLVMPDELLSFPDGHRIPGIVGFPPIDALGEVRFRRDGRMEIPESISTGAGANLALAGLKLITVVGHRGGRFVCQFDSGADTSDFYLPFFEARNTYVTTAGERTTLNATGVGGKRHFEGYRLPRIEITVAGRSFRLDDVNVFTTPVRAETYLYCNIGQDVLRQAPAYTLNLRSMSLTFDPEPGE